MYLLSVKSGLSRRRPWVRVPSAHQKKIRDFSLNAEIPFFFVVFKEYHIVSASNLVLRIQSWEPPFDGIQRKSEE